MKYLCLAVAVITAGLLAFGNAATAQTIWADDFELYPESDPADFSATGNWSHNGVGGIDANANRIFQTGNFGGSLLWIAHPSNFPGTGIDSAAIGVDANTDYVFSANLVAETFAGARDNEFSVDLLLGADLGSAASLIGGPQTVIGRGDGGDGVPADAIDDSYEDQITTIPFSTGAVGAGENLFISIVYVGAGPSGNPGFAGVDNVAVSVIPEPSTIALVGMMIFGIAGLRRRR